MELKAKYKNKKKREHRTKVVPFLLYIGFFAGLLWGGVKLLEYGLRFTKVIPGFLIEPFFRHSFLLTWQGLLLGYAGFIVFSVIAALLYGLMFRKLGGPWPGIGYGLAWWAVLYLLAGPLTGMMPGVGQMDLNSFVTDLCLFAVWGLFIGYSVAMEFTNEQMREQGGGRNRRFADNHS